MFDDNSNFYEFEHYGTISPENMQRYNFLLDVIRKNISLKPLKHILDFGSGDGSFSILLKNRFNAQVYGVDISRTAVDISNHKGIPTDLLNIDKENLPFANDKFDFIFCGEVIEHIYNPDHLLMEIYRVLNKSGFAMLTTPNLASWYNRISLLLGYQPFWADVSNKYGVGYLLPMGTAGHIRLFTLKALKQLVNKYNFSVIKVFGLPINTNNPNYGKCFNLISLIANKVTSIFPSLSSDMMVILRKGENI